MGVRTFKKAYSMLGGGGSIFDCKQRMTELEYHTSQGSGIRDLCNCTGEEIHGPTQKSPHTYSF